MAHGGTLYFLTAAAPADATPANTVAGLRLFGSIDARAVLCIATDDKSAAAVHQHTGMPVAVAGASSQLWKAAHAVRDAFPRLRLLVCGSVNTADKARAAAFSLAGGSYWCIPDFERPGADELTAAAIGLMKKPPVEGETIPTVFLKDAARDLRARDRRRIAEESPATFADLAAWDAGAERVAQQIKAAVGCIGVIKIRPASSPASSTGLKGNAVFRCRVLRARGCAGAAGASGPRPLRRWCECASGCAGADTGNPAVVELPVCAVRDLAEVEQRRRRVAAG
jgi:hypothetical protein